MRLNVWEQKRNSNAKQSSCRHLVILSKLSSESFLFAFIWTCDLSILSNLFTERIEKNEKRTEQKWQSDYAIEKWHDWWRCCLFASNQAVRMPCLVWPLKAKQLCQWLAFGRMVGELDLIIFVSNTIWLFKYIGRRCTRTCEKSLHSKVFMHWTSVCRTISHRVQWK